jgi:predicted PurR-regulated permease PerM
MTEPIKDHPLARFLFVAAAVVFIIWGISQAQIVLVLFLVSAFLAVLAMPPLLWLERKGLPVVAAVLLVMFGMIFVLLTVGAVVGTSINHFYTVLPQYQARIEAQVADFKIFMANRSIHPPEEVLLDYVNPAAIMRLTVDLLGRLGSAFSNIVLILLTAAFILLEAAGFPAKLRAVLGDPNQVFPRFTKFADDMKRYMVIKTIMSAATGILVSLWLYILGVDSPILWGFLAFLLNYVPSIGSTIAGIPAVLLTLVQLGVGRAVFAAAGYVVINFALDYGVEKRMMGRKLGLSTLVVFLSLLFWGSLLGPIGAVLCIPLTMTLKFAFDSSDTTRWVAVLLGPENMPTEEPVYRKRIQVPRPTPL